VGIDLLDPLGLVPWVQDLAAVVEVAGIVPVVVHGRVHRRDQPTVAAGVAGQVQWLTVALAQVSKQPGNPGGRVGGAAMALTGGVGRLSWSAHRPAAAPARPGEGTAAGRSRWAPPPQHLEAGPIATSSEASPRQTVNTP
jgi:hypothetical protein